nr:MULTISPECIES: hypothetical protein [unclassified Bradyrhizobium]
MVCRAADELKIPLNGANSRCSSFGNVGSITALELHKSDRGQRSHGRALSTSGLDIPQLVGHAASQGSLDGYSSELALDPGELLTIPCDVLVPAAWNGASRPK